MSQRRRAVVASTVGTGIEWYDFYLYGTAAALVFLALFFPGQSALAAFGTYFVGFAAPVLLVVLRAIQGIGVGGEWAGSVLLAMEWGSVRRRGLMASWLQLGVPLGLLSVHWHGQAAVRHHRGGAGGYRFLASTILVVIGLYVRLKVAESPEFTQLK